MSNSQETIEEKMTSAAPQEEEMIGDNLDDTKEEKVIEEEPEKVLLSSQQLFEGNSQPPAPIDFTQAPVLPESKELIKTQNHSSSTTIDSPVLSSKDSIDPLGLEVELSFLLGKQSMALRDIKSLVEGKFISLGGSEFVVSIVLEKKVIAYAQLVLVEGAPSLQITKIVAY